MSLGPERPILVDHIHSNPIKNYTFFQRTGCLVLAPAINAHIVVSSGLKKSVQKAFRGRTQHIQIIPPGLNLDGFESKNFEQSDVTDLRKGAKRVIGVVGRLAKEKAFDIFLSSVPTLLDDEPDTRILVVGEGPLLNTLTNLARNLGIGHAVTFTGYHSDIGSVYQAMDVFVLSSWYEGNSLSVIEAMASGVPVVVTDVEGTKDSVSNEDTGLVVSKGDSNAISSGILRLFKEPGLRQRLVENAKNAVLQKSTAKKMTDETEMLYRKLYFHSH